ncbi:MAG: glycosyltransferase family 2 protein [Candidatus Micrarchaeota archaeon]|nr:glycosyltransferase family 2 protein [Candidatus Micrarchaeota archaeon]
MTDITIILPTKNEAGCISKTLERLAQELSPSGLDYEVLVVDDESTDGTQEAVEKFAQKDSRVRLIRHPAPHGFGYSVRDALQAAKGRLAVIMMADLSDDPAFIPPMWEKHKEGYDVVVGSRFMKGSRLRSYPILKLISNRLFNIAVMVAFLTPISDTSNNFKAFDAQKARQIALESQGFEAGAELMLKMLLSGAKIAQIPVSWSDRSDGKAKFRLSGVFLKYFLLFLKMLKLAYVDRLVLGRKVVA